MDPRNSRIGLRCLVGALGLACFLFGIGASPVVAAQTRAAGVRICRGIPPSPHPDCIYPSWAAPYTTKISGSHTPLTKKSFHHNPASGGIYSYETYTITITYADSLKMCPSPTPLEAIPCQSPGPPQISLYGAYVPGQHLLEPIPTGFGQASLTCSPSGTRCVIDYNSYPHQFHGRLDLVFGLTVGELTKNPKGFGPWDAGFEFVAPLNIPPLAK